jgi:dihydroorotate dehydrogenase (NAD+) catalytic subunit
MQIPSGVKPMPGTLGREFYALAGDMKQKADLGVDIGGIKLKNPVMTASGTFGYGLEFDGLIDLNRLGAVIVKGLSLEPSGGNPPPRIIETPCGMLNAIGLENIGIQSFINEKLPLLRGISTPIIANIYGEKIQDYAELARRIDDVNGISGIELNISCPNVTCGGMAFGVDPNAASRVVRAVRARTTKPLMVKLTPNAADVTGIASAVEKAGADALSLINTITGMAVDVHTRKPKLANITGGLSGPAIKPIALRMVWEVAKQVSIPVIGIGGIMSAEDALEFLIAGAKAVQVGTANFVNPKATIDIVEGIQGFLEKKKIQSITHLIGSLKT